jgi:hypothetical protein
MDQPESYTLSFIVRIWLEETVEEGGRAVWRGSIVHVPSGTRGHVTELDGITYFVAPYLEEMGVVFGMPWRVARWLKQAHHHATHRR